MIANLFEFKTYKLNWDYGLFVVLALFVPFIVLSVLHLTQYWTAIALGILFISPSDQLTLGAPIGYRMWRLGSITLVGALLTALGLVLGVNWELEVLGTFVITLLCGAALAWGKPAALAGFNLTMWFLIAITFHGGAAQALPYALAWLIGGAVYMLLALARFAWHPSPSEPAQGTARVQSPGSLFATYFALFRFTSPQFRFVLLKALAVTVGAAIGFGFHLPYGHWVPITTLLALQDDLEQTLYDFVPRLVGTLVGAILAAVLLSGVHNKYLLLLVIFVSAFLANSMRGASKLIFIFFLTIEILLLTDLSTPGKLTDVWARVLDVFIGALVAVVVVFLFMRPSQQKESSSVASG